MALVVAPLTTAVMNAAPDALAGAASGVNNAASRLAGLFAVALVGAIAALVFAAAAGLPEARFGVLPPPGDPAFAAVAAAFDRAYAGRDGGGRGAWRRWPRVVGLGDARAGAVGFFAGLLLKACRGLRQSMWMLMTLTWKGAPDEHRRSLAGASARLARRTGQGRLDRRSR